jgi:hypothetical protein
MRILRLICPWWRRGHKLPLGWMPTSRQKRRRPHTMHQTLMSMLNGALREGFLMSTTLLNFGQKHVSNPRLSRMARVLFTIPAMSDEPERVFSSCGNMVTAQRGNLSVEAIEEAQCIKNWMKNGVITNLGATFEAVASRPEDATSLQK